MTDTLPMPIPAPLTPAQRVTLLNLIRRTARAEILPRFRNLKAAEVDTKRDDQDLVTEADRAAERMLARGILNMFPNAVIIGEEDVSTNPDVLKKIPDAEMAFTIDPVDGTWNFAKGLATFGVIVSMLRFGRPVLGLLYDPVMDDVIIADEQSPVQMLRPRMAPQTLSVSKGASDISELTGYVPLYNLPAEHRPEIAALFPKFARALSLRCSCHEFRMMAQGHVDFVLSGNLTPWDHAAGALITARAGGHVAMLDGREYTADQTGFLLCASNQETWTAVRDALAFLNA